MSVTILTKMDNPKVDYFDFGLLFGLKMDKSYLYILFHLMCLISIGKKINLSQNEISYDLRTSLMR